MPFTAWRTASALRLAAAEHRVTAQVGDGFEGQKAERHHDDEVDDEHERVFVVRIRKALRGD